jgi:hypothetical protein
LRISTVKHKAHHIDDRAVIGGTVYPLNVTQSGFDMLP